MVSEESMMKKVKWVEVNLPSSLEVVEEGAFALGAVHRQTCVEIQADYILGSERSYRSLNTLKIMRRIYTYIYRR